MLFTYSNYCRCKETLEAKYKTWRQHGSKSNFIKILVDDNVIDKTNISKFKRKLDDIFFWDFVIFMQFGHRTDYSFESAFGTRFKLDTTNLDDFNWRIFKATMYGHKIPNSRRKTSQTKNTRISNS